MQTRASRTNKSAVPYAGSHRQGRLRKANVYARLVPILTTLPTPVIVTVAVCTPYVLQLDKDDSITGKMHKFERCLPPSRATSPVLRTGSLVEVEEYSMLVCYRSIDPASDPAWNVKFRSPFVQPLL